MKKILVFILSMLMLLSLVSCTVTPVEEETTTTADTTSEQITTTEEEVTTVKVDEYFSFKIMSFNLLYKNGEQADVANTESTADTTISVRGPKLADMLETEGIDILGVQEARSNWYNWLKKNLCGTNGDYAILGGTTKESGEGGYILYRKSMFSEVDSGIFWLYTGAPTTSTKFENSGFDRICTWALLKLNDYNKYFMILDTHLDHKNVDTTVRGKQAQVIVNKITSLLAEFKETYGIVTCPFALVGDMNSNSSSDVYSIYSSAGYKDSLKASKGHTEYAYLSTSPGFYWISDESKYDNSGHRIDFIWTSKDCTVANYYMIHTSTNLCPYGAYMSDHNAIWSEVKIVVN